MGAPKNNHHLLQRLEGVSNKSDDPATIRSVAEAAIARWNFDLTIFPDGSSVSGFRQGMLQQ